MATWTKKYFLEFIDFAVWSGNDFITKYKNRTRYTGNTFDWTKITIRVNVLGSGQMYLNYS